MEVGRDMWVSVGVVVAVESDGLLGWAVDDEMEAEGEVEDTAAGKINSVFGSTFTELILNRIDFVWIDFEVK